MTTKKPTTKTTTRKTTAKDVAPDTATKPEVPECQGQETRVAPTPKKSKPGQSKVIRDKFSFPKAEHETLVNLKKACIANGIGVKKGELIRAGLHLLTKLSQAELEKAVKQVERIKK